MRPIERIYAIDNLIRIGKCETKRSLAVKFGVDKRTIERDFDFMKEIWKAPIDFDRRARKYYYLEPSYFFPAIPLTESEIFALLLSDMLMSQYKNTPHEKRLRSAFEKIEQFLPEKGLSVDIGRFKESCSFDLGFVRKVDVDLFENLIGAINNRKQLEICYYSIERDKTEWRTVDPYYMKNYRGEWYLLAYCHKSKDIRNFSPVRIKDYRETGVTFELMEGFSPEEYMKRAFGLYRGGKSQNIVVKIDPVQSKWIRELKFDQEENVVKIENHEDGSMTVTFKVENTSEIRRWILQYGHRMEVIEPESFRNEIMEEIRKMREVYGV